MIAETENKKERDQKRSWPFGGAIDDELNMYDTFHVDYRFSNNNNGLIPFRSKKRSHFLKTLKQLLKK